MGGLLGRIFCVLNSHRPVHGKVKWDGMAYLGRCSRCGKSIRRKSHGQWRRESGPAA